MRGYPCLLAAITTAMFLFATGASADTRGLTIKLKASEAKDAPVTEEVRLYGSSHALVIGIDKYTGGWPRLRKAVEDARAVAKELRGKGFEVTLKTNLNAEALRTTLREFFAIKGADPEARLFLWFAGHGHTINGEGFLVPADAPLATSPAFKVAALPMRDFGSLVRLAESKHVLSVFDACFAGTIFEARAGVAPAAITKKTTKPVRQFITSGDAGQLVRDDGSFREYFLRALRGEEKADFNDDSYVTGEELGLFLNQRMAALTGAAQTPKAGKLHDVRYNQGDFVFALAAPPARTSTPASPPAPTGMTAEMMFWQSMKDSTNAADLQDYMSRFPNGTFAGLAKRRLATLTPTTPTGPSPDTIREAQRLLKDLGYAPGTADGRLGGHTRRAIEGFQRSHDLTVDGTVTDALLANLKVARKQEAGTLTSSGDFKRGAHAFDKGDYSTALRIWGPLAEGGYARAQYGLALMYQLGRGISQDYRAALKWSHLAALQDYPSAKERTARLQKMFADPASGTKFKKGLAALYNDEFGDALRQFKTLAEQGHSGAQGGLGLMYKNGEGTTQDYIRAHMWFNISASQGIGASRRVLDEVEGELTPAQIRVAKKFARECVRQNYKRC